MADERAYWRPDLKDYEDLVELAQKYKEARTFTRTMYPRIKDNSLINAMKKVEAACGDGVSAIANFFGRVQAQKFINLIEYGRPYTDNEEDAEE